VFFEFREIQMPFCFSFYRVLMLMDELHNLGVCYHLFLIEFICYEDGLVEDMDQ
jgi:hypothetical protein